MCWSKLTSEEVLLTNLLRGINQPLMIWWELESSNRWTSKPSKVFSVVKSTSSRTKALTTLQMQRTFPCLTFPSSNHQLTLQQLPLRLLNLLLKKWKNLQRHRKKLKNQSLSLSKLRLWHPNLKKRSKKRLPNLHRRNPRKHQKRHQKRHQNPLKVLQKWVRLRTK